MKKLLLSSLLIINYQLSIINLFAQDSSHIRISLLTCTPGDELYSTFGHSGLRLIDSSSIQDIVFNYGTFDFDDPNFYTKFIKGKLKYFVSTAYFKDFKEEYEQTNRGITEQVLNLSASEKLAIQKFLYNNIKEENKYYQYDFLFDNCTTRLRDIIFLSKKDSIQLKPVMPVNTTFRQAIHGYLDKNNKDWSKLGIDILLGSPTDAVMNISQSQFLPDNLMKAIDSADTNYNIELSSASLYPFQKIDEGKLFFTPLVVFSLLLLIIVAMDFSQAKFAKAFLYGFDGLLFFIVGALGIVLLFMWFGTDHAMCKTNYNLLWALPTHAIAAFFINAKKQWLKKYLLFTAIIGLIVLVAWMFLPQALNPSLIPISLLILYRALRKYQSI